MAAVEFLPTETGTRALADRVAIVTGAGHGMGAAIARRFLEEGASVLAFDLRPEGLEEFRGFDTASAMTGDVASAGDVDDAVVTAVRRFGKLDIVVNNAGLMDGFAPVADVTELTWNQVLAVNLTGPMLFCRAAIPEMLKNGGGSIVNIASIGGLAGARAGVAYTSSKHGLIGLTRNVAATYARQGIRCNALCPGAVATGIPTHGMNELGYQALQRTMAANPRIGRPEEIANVVTFLASDQSSFVNGAVLAVDGGWTAS